MNTRRIMHVDDDPQVLRQVAIDLAERGYEVDSLADPTQCLARLEKMRHRVLILDSDMPEINGFDLLRRVKANDGSVAVVMIAEADGMTNVLKAFRWGADYFFFKPLNNVEPLLRAFDSIFDKIDHQWGATLDATKGASEKPRSQEANSDGRSSQLWLTSGSPTGNEDSGANERRSEPRAEFYAKAWAVPLIDGQPDASQVFDIVTKDISSRGMGLVAAAPAPSPDLLICLASQDAGALLRAKVRVTTELEDSSFLLGTQIIEVVKRDSFPMLDEVVAQKSAESAAMSAETV